MMDAAGGARPIMAYVRELEGKLIQCRAIQSRFKWESFAGGLGVGILLTLAWMWFLSHR